MNTLHNNPYRGITPEELHIAIRRAQVERAHVIRTMFASLRAWLRKIGERRNSASADLRAVAGR